jgi:hypothetical protein
VTGASRALMVLDASETVVRGVMRARDALVTDCVYGQTEMRNKKLRRDASLRRERTRVLSTLERKTMTMVQRSMTMFRGNREGTVGVRHCLLCLQAPDILDSVIWSSHNFFFLIPQFIFL